MLLDVCRATGNCLPKAEEVLVGSANTTAEEVSCLMDFANDIGSLLRLMLLSV